VCALEHGSDHSITSWKWAGRSLAAGSVRGIVESLSGGCLGRVDAVGGGVGSYRVVEFGTRIVMCLITCWVQSWNMAAGPGYEKYSIGVLLVAAGALSYSASRATRHVFELLEI
jgi:hypothetical protein